MPNTMQILGWEARGFRCPDHEIDCCNNDGNPNGISLIQMPNGTGKTTTLLLLRAALSGNAQNWKPDQIRQLRKRGAKDGFGQFTLKLRLNSNSLTIIMDVDFENAKIAYKTTGPSGQDRGFQPPKAFAKFMRPDFVNYYAFDGELAEHLLSASYTDANFVIEKLFSFHLLDYIANRIKEYWLHQTKNVTAKDDKGRTRRLNTLVLFGERFNKLTKEKQELDEQRIQKEADLEQKRKLYDQEVSNLQSHSSKLEQTKQILAQNEVGVNTCAKEVLHSVADPHALSTVFARDIKNFKDSLDRVKLPESAAREFFEELAEEENCVCGRPIDDVIRSTIKERAAQYLGSDEFSLLNSMKTAVEEAVGSSLDDKEGQLREMVTRLAQWVRARDTSRNELDELELDAERQDPKVAEAKKEMETLGKELIDIETRLNKYKDGEDRNEKTTDLEILKEYTEQAIKELAEITDTLDLRQKRDILVSILTEAGDNAKRAVVDEICKLTNIRIEELMPYNNIRLETIDRCLILEGQTGGSAGEQLSIAYAFLATLFNSSDQQLPFIVDSPAGSIDRAVRPKIAELVPKLSNQFIAFLISTEIEGFVPRLAATSGNSIKYITLFRKGLTGRENAAKSVNSWVETDDGVIVEDEDFFNNFQIETEEE